METELINKLLKLQSELLVAMNNVEKQKVLGIRLEINQIINKWFDLKK